MKKTALAAFVAIGFAVMAFVAPKAYADSGFEGIVTYSISVDNPQMAPMLQGASMKTYIKGDKTKTCSDMGMSKTTVITDKDNPDGSVFLIELMGNKYQLKNDKTKKDDEKGPEIKYTDETKQIAGYTCHKAEVTITDQQGQSYTANVYYTEELPATQGKGVPFKGLKGFPLEYSMKQQGMTILMSATSVTKQAVPDDTFTVPSGYKLMTAEEMQQDIQKNMGDGN